MRDEVAERRMKMSGRFSAATRLLPTLPRAPQCTPKIPTVWLTSRDNARLLTLVYRSLPRFQSFDPARSGMRFLSAVWLTGVLCLLSSLSLSQESSATRPRVLDPSSMETGVDPCVDFYTYSCGGWMKKNAIPPDQSSWSVYGKLQDNNREQLRGILEAA